MKVDLNEQESERYHELIAKAQDALDDEDVGSEDYNTKLGNLKTLQTLKTLSDNVQVNEAKIESAKDKWFDRGLKILGVVAPFAVTAIMIWWDRKDDGGHIMSQYINPALRSGDGAKK